MNNSNNGVGGEWSPGRIGIVGSGSWATALAKIILTTQPSVNWYFRYKETTRQFREEGHNPGYLTDLMFDTRKIHFYTDVRRIVQESDTVLLVTPSPYIKGILSKFDADDLEGKFFFNAVKGIVPEDNILISEYLNKHFGVPDEMIGVVSGPCHAEEVALDRVSYLTVGCSDILKAEKLSEVLRSDLIHCHTSRDVIGIEYGSVLKNIYAIASGMCMGMRYGDNFQAVLMANAAKEMERFVSRVHPMRERDIKDSVYLGDLLVTGYSRYSRNRTFGTLLGKGYSVKQAQLQMEMVAEGYYGSKCVHEVNQTYQVNLPIAEAMYKVLYERFNAKQAIKRLADTLI